MMEMSEVVEQRICSLFFRGFGGPRRAQLEELLAEADVVVQGYRPGALARFGLSSA